eukprot:m.32642 g.32642  ORF g.32642 m.32642 type:complete len:67 (-) comp7068_c0_seq1:3911-4111(-)
MKMRLLSGIKKLADVESLCDVSRRTKHEPTRENVLFEFTTSLVTLTESVYGFALCNRRMVASTQAV